jgi:hypothetical protein
MGLIAGAIVAAAPAIIKMLIGDITKLGEQYINKELSKEEFESRVKIAATESYEKVETAWAEAAPEIYESFMARVERSWIVRAVWAATSISQLLVILWHQVGIPAYVHLTGNAYPSSGGTFEYAYLLLAACIGVGPIVMKGKAKPLG